MLVFIHYYYVIIKSCSMEIVLFLANYYTNAEGGKIKSVVLIWNSKKYKEEII